MREERTGKEQLRAKPPQTVGHGLLNVLKGFCMGSADIIPGVSGGTMALILGIYERLLKAIRSFDRDWLADLLQGRWVHASKRIDWPLLMPLGLGMVAAIVFFTRVVPLPVLLETHTEQVYALFFGLILASVVILMGEVDRYGLRQWLMAGIGTTLGLVIVNTVPLQTPDTAWFIFLCGFIAISAMLLPGISGSFILLILGKYATLITALGNLDLWVLGVFAAGMVTGLAAFSRAIVWLLARYRQSTLLVIKGLLIGSLWVIWPFQERSHDIVAGKSTLVSVTPVWPGTLDATVWAALGLFIAGFVGVMLLHRLAGRPRLAD